jgi:hypothetical protein
MPNQLAAVIAVLGCAGGCATTGGKASAVVAAVTATGTVLVATQSTGCERDGGFGQCLEDAGMILGLGLLTGAALFTGLMFEVYGAPDKPPAPGLVQADGVPVWPPSAAPVVPLGTRDPRAAQLTHEAYLAARVGRCSLVGVLGAKVRDLDRDYYEQVFVSDRAIASCL